MCNLCFQGENETIVERQNRERKEALANREQRVMNGTYGVPEYVKDGDEKRAMAFRSEIFYKI
jgi:hypothetical protein